MSRLFSTRNQLFKGYDLGVHISILVVIVWFVIGAWVVIKEKHHYAPPCKVCHCNRTVCAATCSEENMCQLRCERECHEKH